MHRQFKPDPEAEHTPCTGCGRVPHYYTCPRGVFAECSPCGRRTSVKENETLARYDWALGRFIAIGRAA